MSVHQVCVLCRPLGRGDHQLCLNMDACPQDTRNLSRDRSDLQARGYALGADKVSALAVLPSPFQIGDGLTHPQRLWDIASRDLLCTYSNSDRVGVSLHLNGMKRRYPSHCS